MNPDDIPGVAEARASERLTRAEAFLGVPRLLCGLESVPLTLHRLSFLVLAGNALFEGGEIDEKAVGDFLWAVSPGFQVGNRALYADFCFRLGESASLLDLAACVQEVSEFIDDQFLDAPAGGSGSKVPVISTEAKYVGLFAEAFGWTAETTLHLPLPQLYQLLRYYALSKNPDATFIHRRSDKVRGDWLRSHQAAAETDLGQMPIARAKQGEQQ